MKGGFPIVPKRNVQPRPEAVTTDAVLRRAGPARCWLNVTTALTETRTDRPGTSLVRLHETCHDVKWYGFGRLLLACLRNAVLQSQPTPTMSRNDAGKVLRWSPKRRWEFELCFRRELAARLAVETDRSDTPSAAAPLSALCGGGHGGAHQEANPQASLQVSQCQAKGGGENKIRRNGKVSAVRRKAAELSHKQSVIFKAPLHNSCSYFIPLRVGKDASFLCCKSQVSSLGGVWQLLERLT